MRPRLDSTGARRPNTSGMRVAVAAVTCPSFLTNDEESVRAAHLAPGGPASRARLTRLTAVQYGLGRTAADCAEREDAVESTSCHMVVWCSRRSIHVTGDDARTPTLWRTRDDGRAKRMERRLYRNAQAPQPRDQHERPLTIASTVIS